MIRLENITKSFLVDGKNFCAVNDVNLEIKKGEIFGIIGFSGAGKSTLVRCINLLERPDSGKVFVNDRELTALSAKDLRLARRKISMIFQHFNLLKTLTVEQNVAFPLKGTGLSKAQIAARVKELLELVELSEKAKAYPSELSGGQKQRVAIARALATNPEIILSDESTSALDPQTTKSILHLLKKLNQELGITVVAITHEMAVIKEICNRVAVMENGEIIEQGPVFEIFANPKKDITRRFIKSTSNLQKIDELVAENSEVTALKPGEVILRLSYLAKNVSEPLISTVSRTFNIDLNIIFADIEIIQDAPVGGTVAIVSGDKKNIEDAIAWLKNKNVGVEVIKNG